MRQRVAFLRTIMMGQELLLLDEPFGALDALTKRNMQSWLLGLWGELQKTVLFITHDLEEAILLSDRIIYCRKHMEEDPGSEGELEKTENARIGLSTRVYCPEERTGVADTW